MDTNKLLLDILSIHKKISRTNCTALQIKLRKLEALFIIIKKIERNKIERKRNFWVHPIFSVENRRLQGASDNLVRELYVHNDDKFINYFRMPVAVYNKLFGVIEPYITKQECVREAIPANIRLQICLRYLASGDSMRSLSYAFRVAHNTISKIVSETCEVIWILLKDKVFPQPRQDTWKRIAEEFDEKWNFIHCIGAIDGKHVIIQAPAHSGSAYYNYKGQHSFNLIALCDAQYRFTFVDIGAEGRQSDSGVFQNTTLYALEENSLQIPPPEVVGVRGPVLPYVIVADEAFALKNYMMRPYPRSQNLNQRKKVFNYRLSRARRVIESSFGILASRWRIFRKPIITSVALGKKIVQATCCLHNFLIDHEGNDRFYSTVRSTDLQMMSEGLQDFSNEIHSHYPYATNIRGQFAEYFEGDGAIPWQWEKVLHNDF